MRAGGEILPWIRSKMNSSASLVDQLVKNLPVMQKTWVQSLGWEDPLEKGMTTHFSNSMDCVVHGVAKSQLFTAGGQSIVTSASVLPVNIQA